MIIITKKQEGFHEDRGAEEKLALRAEPDYGRREAPESFFVPFVKTFLLLREKNHQVARTGTQQASWDECRDIG